MKVRKKFFCNTFQNKDAKQLEQIYLLYLLNTFLILLSKLLTRVSSLTFPI